MSLSQPNGRSFLTGCSDGNLVNGRYMNPTGISSVTDEDTVGAIIPFAGTIKNFYVSLSGSPGAAKSWILTIRKNKAATTLVVTISDTNTAGNDVTNSFTVAAGDKITIGVSVSGSPAARKAQWGFEYA